MCNCVCACVVNAFHLKDCIHCSLITWALGHSKSFNRGICLCVFVSACVLLP